MIQIVTTGNVLEDPAQAIVIPVNTVGTMGKGLALQAARRYPVLLTYYRKAWHAGLLSVGKVLVLNLSNCPRFVIFPTKAHWRSPSRLEYIETGLQALALKIRLWDLHSIAIPALGCGLGGLDWNIVRPTIEAALGDLPIHVRLYAPQEGG